MKKLFYVLMLVLGMGVLSSCSKEGINGSIIGTWELTEYYYTDNGERHDRSEFVGVTLIVTEDTMTVSLDGVLQSDPYTRDGNKLYIGNEYVFFITTLTSTKMALKSEEEENGDHAVIVFKKR